jgi:hypothetical protein
VADGWCWFVLREKYCWLVAGGWFLLREKHCWLVADKPSEQAAGFILGLDRVTETWWLRPGIKTELFLHPFVLVGNENTLTGSK